MKNKIEKWEWSMAAYGFFTAFAYFLLYSFPTAAMGIFALYSSKKLGLFPALGLLLFMFLVAFYIIKRAIERNIMERPDFRQVWRHKFKILFAFLVCLLVGYFLPLTLSKLNINLPVSQNQALINSMAEKIPIFLMFISTSIYAPICEEIIFRASIRELIFPFHPRLAFIVSTILFAFAHMGFSLDWINWLLYLSMGAVFGWLYLKSRRVETTMSVHFLWNTFANIVNFL